MIKQTCSPYQSGHTMVSSYGYSADDKSLLTSVFHKKDNSTTKASFSYTNNLDGSIHYLNEVVGTISGTSEYEYGVLGGLTKDTRINSYAYGNNYSYTGDNLTQITNGNAVTNLSYNWNQLTSASSTTGGQNFSAIYDNPATAPGYGSGSCKTYYDGTTTWHYTYDVDGNLTSVSAGSTVVYSATYDGLGRICKENDNGAITYWLYDAGGNQAIALLSDGNLKTQYIWGTTGILASYNNPLIEVPEDGFSMGSMSSSASSENTFEPLIEKRFYFDDGRGNVRLLTDESINQTARYAYDSWGNDLDASLHSGVSQPFTWNGGNGYTHSESSNLYHARRRNYCAKLKQWISRNPKGYSSGESNLYAYCANDPINSIDPSGMYDVDDALKLYPEVYKKVKKLLKSITDTLGLVVDVVGSLNEGSNCAQAVTGYTLSGKKMNWLQRGLSIIPVVGALARGAEETLAVYRAMDRDGNVIYVGITNGFKRRALEHLRNSGYEIELISKLLENLSKSDARSVEQALIELHGLQKNGGTLNNLINRISKCKPGYAKSLQRGYELLKKAHYPGVQ